ncbi:MAG: ATP-dependent helicase [Candidatus Riflebacteria bacterium]|nr:ATP-dependent helicase [Candidatus Riflebacteria bacterium]
MIYNIKVMTDIKKILEDLTKGLTTEQAEAVTFPPKGKLRISAGAGSGKTEVLTRRIDALLKQGIKPEELVAITYTTKAASEMKDRLIEKRKISPSVLRKMEVATFHSFLSRFLKQDPFGAGIDSSITVIDENTREILMLDLADKFAEQFGEKIINGENALGADIAAKLIEKFPLALSKIRRYLLSPGEFYRKAKQELNSRGTDLEFKTLEWLFQFYSLYMEELEKRNLLDFDEILIKSKHLIQNMRENSISPDRRIFLIDEFQDNNPNQLGIVEEFCRNRESQICVVGDEKQSIYRFQGAKVDTFRNFASDQDIILKDNFRSYSEIIDFADNYLEKGGDIGKMFVKQNAKRGNSPRYPAVSCLLSPEDMDAATISQHIVQFIHEIVASGMTIPDRKNNNEMRQIRYGDIAIILNSVKNLPINFEDAMTSFQIPYVISGGFGLYDRSEIEDLLSFLKLLIQPEDDYSVVKILTGPLYGLKDSDLAKLSLEGKFDNIRLLPRILAIKEENLPEEAINFRNLYISIKERANKPGLVNLCHSIIEQAGFYEYSATLDSELKTKRINNNIAKFLGIVRDFEQNGVFTSLRDFLNHIERTRIADIDEDEAGLGLDEGDAVKIMTIHKSKGLEFPLVILPFLKGRNFRFNEKIIYDDQFGLIVNEKTSTNSKEKTESPILDSYKQIDKNESMAEEYRKLYVAFTRAENLLVTIGEKKHSIPPENLDTTAIQPLYHIVNILKENSNFGEINELQNWQEILDKWLKSGKADNINKQENNKIQTKSDIEMLENSIKSIGNYLESQTNAVSTIANNNKDIFSLQELALFKNCPRKYYFSTLHLGSFEERLEQIQTLVGKLAHESIRLFHENDGHKLEMQDAINLIESFLDKLLPCYETENPKELKSKTMTLLNRYIESDLSRIKPWLFEAEVNVKFDGNSITKPFFIRGFVDRVDLEEGNNIKIIDFKTREYCPEAHESYKRQLALYRIASSRGVIGEMGQLNFTNSYIAYLNPKGLDLREIEPNLNNFEEESAQIVANIRKEQLWLAQKSELCNDCQYKNLCLRELKTEN